MRVALAACLFSRGAEEFVLESFHRVTTTPSGAWAPPTLALEPIRINNDEGQAPIDMSVQSQLDSLPSIVGSSL